MSKIAGVDEAGRGPLAGPVVAAAVILPEDWAYGQLDDSKKITEARREKLYQAITQHAISWAIGQATVAEIDELNILQATFLAMQRAVAGLAVTPDEVLIDGRDVPALSVPGRAIIGGDATVAAISAASIIAKVTRDRLMVALDEYFPEFGFAKHKGYGTKVHMQALVEHGRTKHHRMSFAPVRACEREYGEVMA